MRLIGLLGLLAAFGPLSLDMYLAGLPALAEELHAPVSAAQLTLTACLVGLAMGQLIAGPLSDSIGRRTPLLVGLATYAVASTACALAPTIEVLVAARLTQGLAGAAGIVIARAIVADLYTGVDAARFFSVLMLVHGVAPILAPILGGQLLTITSWRAIFLVLAAIGIVLFVVTLTTLVETLPRPDRHGGGVPASLRAFGRLLTDARFLGYALSCGLAFGSMFAYIAGGPFVLQELHGLSAQAFSLLFAGNAAGYVLAGQLNGRLVGRVAPQRLLVAGLATGVFGAVGLLGATLTGAGLAVIATALFFVVAPLGFVLPNAAALALAGHRSTAGSASALLGALQLLIGAAVAPLVGLEGGDTALVMAGLIAGLSVAALLWLALMTWAGRRG